MKIKYILTEWTINLITRSYARESYNIQQNIPWINSIYLYTNLIFFSF